jgi:uncharacterized protein (DUF3084 family)
MSIFGILALVLLPILGGLIAWAGDVIGYRLGKSRRTLFGLRPRSTARLVGVAVGVALPLVGLLAALAGSSSARDAILNLDRLRSEQKTLRQQNIDLDTRVSRARQDAAAAEQQVKTLRTQVTTEEEHTRAATAAYHKAQASLQQTRTQVDTLRRTTDTLRRSADTLRRTADTLRRTKQSLDQQIAKLKTEAAKLQADLRKATTDLAVKVAELATREGELTARQAEIKSLDASVKLLEETLRYQGTVVTGPVIFEPGHELVRAIVPVEESQEEMERTLKALLLPASEVAAQLGAGLAPNGLAVIPIRPLPQNLAAGEQPTGDQIVAAVATQLRTSGKDKFVVGLRVLRRMFQGERTPALVEYWAVPYARVFAKDEVITSVTIDGTESRTEIFNQLWNLITKLVRLEAQKKGLLPHPKTGEYGQLPSGQLLEALDSISAAKQSVTVDVKAARDTFTTDSLTIRIEVRSDKQASLPDHRG